LEQLLTKLLKLFPKAQLRGHRDMPGSVPNACPCGTYIQKKAVSLLKAGMYDLTGTDMHSSKHFKEWLGTRIGSRDRDMLWAHFPACRDGL